MGVMVERKEAEDETGERLSKKNDIKRKKKPRV